jgi:hypothetical protein
MGTHQVEIRRVIRAPGRYHVVKKTMALAGVPAIGEFVGTEPHSDFNCDCYTVERVMWLPDRALVEIEESTFRDEAGMLGQMSWIGERGWVLHLSNPFDDADHAASCRDDDVDPDNPFHVIACGGAYHIVSDAEIQVLTAMKCPYKVVSPAAQT